MSSTIKNFDIHISSPKQLNNSTHKKKNKIYISYCRNDNEWRKIIFHWKWCETFIYISWDCRKQKPYIKMFFFLVSYIIVRFKERSKKRRKIVLRCDTKTRLLSSSFPFGDSFPSGMLMNKKSFIFKKKWNKNKILFLLRMLNFCVWEYNGQNLLDS